MYYAPVSINLNYATPDIKPSYVNSKITAHCPYCGTCINPDLKQQSNFLDYNDMRLVLLTHYVWCCKKYFLSVHEVYFNSVNTWVANLLTTYPNQKGTQLPPAFNKISPRFVDLYNQSYWAEQNNYTELAGSGYRNAMEVLIKDYAKVELGATDEDIRKCPNLQDAIIKYLPEYNMQLPAHVVRLIGNDYTHYERRYINLEVDILKDYLNILMLYIKARYLINHPPEEIVHLLPRNQS